jgi:hypothetical protein
VRHPLFLDRAADRVAEALAPPRSLPDDVVQTACLVPKAELPRLNSLGDVLASAAKCGQLEVVDDAGTIRGQMGDDAALNEVDEIAGQAKLDRVAAEHESNGAPQTSSQPDGVNELTEHGMAVWLYEWHKSTNLIDGEIIATFREGPELNDLLVARRTAPRSRLRIYVFWHFSSFIPCQALK